MGLSPRRTGSTRKSVLWRTAAAGLVVVAAAGTAMFTAFAPPITPVAYAPAAPVNQPVPLDLGPIRIGSPVQGDLPEFSIHQWSFVATAGQVITLRLTTAASAEIDILPPDGMFSLASAGTLLGEGSAVICRQLLDQSGTYILWLHSRPGTAHDAFGPYEISLDDVARSVATLVVTDGDQTAAVCPEQ